MMFQLSGFYCTPLRVLMTNPKTYDRASKVGSALGRGTQIIIGTAKRLVPALICAIEANPQTLNHTLALNILPL